MFNMDIEYRNICKFTFNMNYSKSLVILNERCSCMYDLIHPDVYLSLKIVDGYKKKYTIRKFEIIKFSNMPVINTKEYERWECKFWFQFYNKKDFIKAKLLSP